MLWIHLGICLGFGYCCQLSSVQEMPTHCINNQNTVLGSLLLNSVTPQIVKDKVHYFSCWSNSTVLILGIKSSDTYQITDLTWSLLLSSCVLSTGPNHPGLLLLSSFPTWFVYVWRQNVPARNYHRAGESWAAHHYPAVIRRMADGGFPGVLLNVGKKQRTLWKGHLDRRLKLRMAQNVGMEAEKIPLNTQRLNEQEASCRIP